MRSELAKEEPIETPKDLDDHLLEIQFQQLTSGLVKLVHQTKIASRIAGRRKKFKKVKQKNNLKKTEADEKPPTKQRFFIYKIGISHDYARAETFYRGKDAYELHYGSETKRAFTTFAKQESYYTESQHKTLQENETEKGVLSSMDAQQKIQKIIYAKLLGSLGDISVEDREMFTHWRKFNKTLRRLYEGGHYDTSITKTV